MKPLEEYRRALEECCTIVDRPSLTPMEKAVRMGDVANRAIHGRGGPGSWRLEWQPAWPTQPGRYWFYGKLTKAEEKDALFIVTVSGTLQHWVHLYSVLGVLIYEKDGGKGHWLALHEPALPDGTPPKEIA